MGLGLNDLGRIGDPADLFGKRATDQATDFQRILSAEALALQQEFADVLRADGAPVRETRDLAINRLLSGRGLPQDPSFSYQRDELVNRLNRGAVAGGKYNSGQRLMDMQDLEGGLASQSTTQGMNRLLNIAGFNTRDLTNQNTLLQNNINQQGNAIQFDGALQTANRVGNLNNVTNGITQGVSLGSGIYNNRRYNDLVT
jgi:hypothetical protein